MIRGAAILCGIFLGACTPTTPRNTGVYLLLDTSGSYNKEITNAERVVLYTLSKLGPTDSFAVARIDTGSFSEKDIIAKATFDDRPSTANAQKRAFSAGMRDFIEHSERSGFTDITGGLLQATEFLNEKQTGRKIILVFSDLKEDLDKGYVRDVPLEFQGFEVVALNVTKLRTDNLDPREYLARVDAWRTKVENNGGRWRVINDLEHLEGML